MRILNLLFGFIIGHCTLMANAQDANFSNKLPQITNAAHRWADSVYQQLSLEQRIGQLFMLAAYSGGPKINRAEIEKAITNNHIGGLIFMQGTAEAQAEMTNAYQSKSKVPLLIAMDAEWGLGMRLTGVMDLPRQLMMGAMQDKEVVYKYGKAVAQQCKRLGVHVNFAPVVDINNNPDNPVINFRSFGENKGKVAEMGIQYMKGLQDNNILACAKHFPGHGNTNTDSHLDLPTIDATRSELNALELYPFKQLIKAGLGSMMIAHLQVPALDETPKTPTTLSSKVVTSLLKEELNFSGLIFTDALNMEGVAKYYAPGEVDVLAFSAGNDVLLFSKDAPAAISKIKTALQNGKISEERLEESVIKILVAKYKAGLAQPKIIKADGATADCNAAVSSLRTEIATKAITLLNDQNNVLRKIKEQPTSRKIVITFGSDTANAFSEKLAISGFRRVDEAQYTNEAQVRDADFAVISLHGLTPYPANNFGVSKERLASINKLLKFRNTMLVIFGNPYIVKNFCEANSLLVAYDDKPETHAAAAQILMSTALPQGTLPVGVCEKYIYGAGKSTADKSITIGNVTTEEDDDFGNVNDNIGLRAVPSIPTKITCCVNPISIGADEKKLDKIDAFINSCIEKGAFPGCRILLAKDGKVFYDKAFGYLDNKGTSRVEEGTMYDLASVTKVLSTNLAVMKLYEKNKLNLEATLGDYLPKARGTNKQDCKIKDLLLHRAGLVAWIPFYKATIDSNKDLVPGIYNNKFTPEYKVRVAPGLFMKKSYIDTMWTRIYESEVGPKQYVYSDLDFIFLQQVVEKITGMGLDEYVEKEFYKPLGLKEICFNPLSKGKKVANIAPSEADKDWRDQDVRGFVHDMAAAMFGGVSGHAGLFSNASDISIIQQMLLNGGTYNGKRFFDRKTVDLFTSYNGGSTRRGLGWDKPEAKGGSSPTAKNASTQTFGHQGFTGTCIWADPKYNIQYIFLSNRTYPNADNKKITSLDVRPTIQKYAYEALGIWGR